MSNTDADNSAIDEEVAAEESHLNGSEFETLFTKPTAEQTIRKEKLGEILPSITEAHSRAEKSVALEKALRAISSKKSGAALSDEDFESLKVFFCSLYGGNPRYRHKYSSLCTLMFDLLEENEGQAVDLADDLPYELITLATNMTAIREYIERASIDTNSEPHVTAEVLESVQKLDDHIELEFQRMRYLVKQNSTLHRNVDDLTQRFQSRVETAEKALTKEFERSVTESKEKSSAEMDDVKSKFEEDIKEAEARSQRNYVSVLGIFISLVISFSAGIRLSTEAVQALSAMSVYRFAITLTVVVFGMSDLILTLLFFILLVSNIDGGAKKIIKVVGIVGNIAFALILVVIIVAKALRLFG